MEYKPEMAEGGAYSKFGFRLLTRASYFLNNVKLYKMRYELVMVMIYSLTFSVDFLLSGKINF